MKLGLMTTETLAELSKRIISISKKEIYGMVHTHALLARLETTAGKYLAVFDKATYSGLGKQVAEADAIRDDLFVSFRDVVNGFAGMRGLAIQSSALELKQVINQHGNGLYTLSYGDESSHLDKLIEALNQADKQSKLESLHLTDSYLLLKNAQQAFTTLYNKQVEANAELRSKLPASSIARELKADLRNYLNYVEAMGTIENNWQTLSLELEEVVKAARNSRQSREAEHITNGAK